MPLSGPRPLAIVDNLNFGNPENPEVMWQFTETLAGLSTGCFDLDVPIVGGNVSFYNETDGVDIYPTPVVGMLGLADPMPPLRGTVSSRMAILVCGPTQSTNLAGSAVQAIMHGTHAGRPTDVEPVHGTASINTAIRIAHEIDGGILHDISKGGALVALAELLMPAGVGASLSPTPYTSAFGEDPHRFLCLVPAERIEETVRIAVEEGNRIELWGATTGVPELTIGHTNVVPVQHLAAAWRGAIANRMAGGTGE